MYFQELKTAERRQDEKRTFLWKDEERIFCPKGCGGQVQLMPPGRGV